MIPREAEKPSDPRREKKPPKKSLSSELSDLIAATTAPMLSDDPDSVMQAVTEERQRLQYEAELNYLRGNFEQVIRCFQKTAGDDAARLRICPAAVAAAISIGDYRVYTDIDAFLRDKVRTEEGGSAAIFASLALATAAVSMIAPDMAPDWLKTGDFSALPSQTRPNALYLRAKYFHSIGKHDAMLAVAQTALALSDADREITATDIYLRITCTVACHALEREDEARRWLLEAMNLALPHGFITPFAEVVTALGGLMEQCLEQAFPACRDAVLGQWKRTWKNWITFHNQFTKDNITLVLSLREYHIALLASQRVPYAQIAKQYCISVGRLKNIMLGIYGKLFISSRDELAKYVF